jgi:hypothetical protein
LPSYLSLFGGSGVLSSLQPVVRSLVQTGWQLVVIH